MFLHKPIKLTSNAYPLNTNHFKFTNRYIFTEVSECKSENKWSKYSTYHHTDDTESSTTFINCKLSTKTNMDITLSN